MTEERKKLARELVAKFPPGPWRVLFVSGRCCYEIVNTEDIAVAEVWDDNIAALVAAAPELLTEALDSIDGAVAVASKWPHNLNGRPRPSCVCPRCEMLRELKR